MRNTALSPDHATQEQQGAIYEINQNQTQNTQIHEHTQVAQQYLIADAISRGMFGVNLLTFTGLRQDFGGSYTAGNNSNELTAAELLNRAMGGSGGMSASWQAAGGVPHVIKSNMKKNAIPMLTAVVGIPIAFNIGKKLLRKPIITPANRMLKAAGLTGVKV